MTAQYVICHYTKPHTGNQCTAEVVDEHAEIWLCQRHLAMALRLVKDRQAEAKKGVLTRPGSGRQGRKAP